MEFVAIATIAMTRSISATTEAADNSAANDAATWLTDAAGVTFALAVAAAELPYTSTAEATQVTAKAFCCSPRLSSTDM
jgi:hypothetical protein